MGRAIVAHNEGQGDPGNRPWIRADTWLGHHVDRRAEDCQAGLLMDADEALTEGMNRA